MNTRTQRRNRVVLVGLVMLVAGMVGLSFAAVPLYDLFCKVTGYGGTTQVAEALPEQVLDRTLSVRFNANVHSSLDWDFRPVVNEVQVKLGESATIAYRARNNSAVPLVGTATFNVTPAKAGQYFNKVQCFCFDQQRLEPGQEIEMPVLFFVDPALAQDPNLSDVGTITLSYTFFRAKDDPGLGQVSENKQ